MLLQDVCTASGPISRQPRLQTRCVTGLHGFTNNVITYTSKDVKQKLGTLKKYEQQQLFDEDGESTYRHDASAFMHDRSLLMFAMSLWTRVWSSLMYRSLRSM
jgi:hypothetical protein